MEKKSGLREEFHKLVRDLIKYYELKWEYFKLELVESLAQLYTKVFAIFLMWLIVPLTLVFLLVALAFYLGKLWNAYYLGFLAVAGIVFLLGLIVLLLRKPLITNPLVDALIAAMFDVEQQEVQLKPKQNQNAKNTEDKDSQSA